MFGLNYKDNEQVYEEQMLGGMPVLTFPILSGLGFVTHGVSTRMGGVSEGIWSSMNLSFSRGDDPEHVMENYRRFAAALGSTPEKIVCTQQTHTTNVRIVTKEDAGCGVTKERGYTDVDGLITNEPGILLASFYADCVPLIFADPVKKVVATSHSGWRGTVAGMGRVTIQKMQEEFGCDPADIRACVGPSICQDCYEVSEDVICQFRNAFPEEVWSELFYRKENGKYQLNLWKANEWILRDAGIKEEHLQVGNLCTCCNPEKLFSHRASKGQRGNLAAFIGIK